MAQKRLEVLDIIKGLMIIFVVTTHYRFNYPEDYQKYGFFFWIDMAVPVFMIVSGYLTSYGLENKGLCLK